MTGQLQLVDVIVAEDTELWRTALSSGLQERGYSVRTAITGDSALSLILDKRPRVFVSDILLPGIEGHSLCKFLKDTDEGRPTVTIVLSGILVGGIDRKKLEYADAAIAKGPIHATVKLCIDTIEMLLKQGDRAEQIRELLSPVELSHREVTSKLIRLLQQRDALFRVIGEAAFEIDRNNRILRLNPRACDFLNRLDFEVMGRDFMEVLEKEEASPLGAALNEVWSLDAEDRVWFEDQVNSRVVAGSLTKMGQPESGSETALVIFEDISKNISIKHRLEATKSRLEARISRMQEELHQSQKMEAVGRLAGGIAHDFNNILTAIKGYTQLLLARDDLTPGARLDLRELERAADKAANLTSRLLTFARRQVVEPRRLDPAEVVQGLRNLLERTLGEDITVIVDCGTNKCSVMMDPVQLEQVILNLAINSRDAMPKGGTLEVSIHRVTIADDSDETASLLAEPGDYVKIEVKDTGSGIEEKDLPHIFEPFFTTKAEGEGSGIGLSTVYGIVKQCNGYIRAFNRPEGGAIFSILLPAAGVFTEDVGTAGGPDKPVSTGAGRRVMIVDDEKLIVNTVERLLTYYGFDVVTASSGEDALSKLERLSSDRSEVPEILLIDVVMPSMSGLDLVHEIRRRGYDLKVIYISGHSSEILVKRGLAAGHGDAFVAKPFSAEQLIQAIDKVSSVPGE